MYNRIFCFVILICLMLMHFSAATIEGQTSVPELKFDHNHTYSEMVIYLKALAGAYPNIARLHNIGKSYLGRDLLVLEITNQGTGNGIEKPGYWIDGNLHASEVMGAEVCLKTIETLVSKYGKDAFITNLVDTRTVYIMPKLNPDGAEHYLTRPDGMRSVVRPHDSDGDGLLDEDPPEDLDGDGNIVQMRIRSDTGPMKTSPEDSRLLVRCKEDEKGEWRVYSEGIDNDNDGRFNEDGIGGLDINRNWPSQWQQEWRIRGSGPYALSEAETRAVADFLLSHRNVTGTINYHMSGNFLIRPPCALRPDPVTGVGEPFPDEDGAVYQILGKKYTEIFKDQRFTVMYGGEGSPYSKMGLMLGWAYDHYGVVSWLPEIGSYVPFCDYDKDGTASQLEQLKWNDTEMNRKIFVDWKPYDHPQLGKVEIGGFIQKLYNPKYNSYNHLMCNPGPIYEDFLEKYTRWNLYLISMSPLVRITDVKVNPWPSGYFKIEASIQNQGFLPTNVTQHAIRNKTVKTVIASISLTDADLVMGKENVDIGHLPGNRSLPKTVEWMVKARGEAVPKIIIKTISEKGGTDTKELTLDVRE